MAEAPSPFTITRSSSRDLTQEAVGVSNRDHSNNNDYVTGFIGHEFNYRYFIVHDMNNN